MISCSCSNDIVWSFTVIEWRSSDASRTEQRRRHVDGWSRRVVGRDEYVQKPDNDRYHSAAGSRHTAVGSADRQVRAVARKQPCRRYCYNRSRPLKPKFHYADFPVMSTTSLWQTRDNPFSPNSITPTSPKLPIQGSFGEVGVMEFGLKGTSRVCRGRHGEVGIVELGLYMLTTGQLELF